MSNKIRTGNFFEDFRLGQVIRHGTPRTITDGDAALYIALTGSRGLAQSSALAAAQIGFTRRPADDILVFNIAFGKTVPDISLNAVANLGYAEVRFLQPVFSGDTLRCESVVIGLRENSNGQSGIVYVKSSCFNQDEHPVLTWVRWVMVQKSMPEVSKTESHVPDLVNVVSADRLIVRPKFSTPEAVEEWCDGTCTNELWDDYVVGERIDHPSGMTLEEADHMLATRLYQNNARPHFDALAMKGSAVGRRLVYGGHIISTCRALAYDGLENVVSVLAFNAGTHVGPSVAGDTIYAYTEVLDKWALPGRTDMAALRLRLMGLKNIVPYQVASVPIRVGGKTAYHPNVVLDLDYTVLMPRRSAAASHN